LGCFLTRRFVNALRATAFIVVQPFAALLIAIVYHNRFLITVYNFMPLTDFFLDGFIKWAFVIGHPGRYVLIYDTPAVAFLLHTKLDAVATIVGYVNV
jgi:hypothetical protein